MRAATSERGDRDPASWVAELAEPLRRGLSRVGVPGWQLAICSAGQVYGAEGGLADVDGAVQVTPRTQFRCASVTKVLTAGALLEVLPALDTPVVEVLGAGPWRDWDRITAAHLLTHTSGVVGDFFPVTGEDDDAVERYVSALAQQCLLHEPGQLLSYSNAGFVLAGRLTELLTGCSWEKAVQAWLARLGCTSEIAFAPAGDGDVAVTYRTMPLLPDPLWPRDRGLGPAGSTLIATARDLAQLLAQQLREAGGRSSEPGFPLPHRTFGSAVSGGWFMEERPRGQLLKHTGGSVACVLAVPDQDVTMVFLSNGTGATPVFLDAASGLVDRLVGKRQQRPGTPTRLPTADALQGTYAHGDRQISLALAGGRLVLRDGEHDRVLVPLDGSTLVPEDDSATPLTAHGSDDVGRTAYVQWQLRIFERAGEKRG